MLPIFEGAVNLLREDVPNLTVVIPTTQSQSLVQHIEATVERWSLPVLMLPGASDVDKYNAFAVRFPLFCELDWSVKQVCYLQLSSFNSYIAISAILLLLRELIEHVELL
jgi:lipid-A-disaccharide synthase